MKDGRTEMWKDGYIKVTVSARGEVLSVSHEAELVFGRVNMTLGCTSTTTSAVAQLVTFNFTHCGDAGPRLSRVRAASPLSHVSLHVLLIIRCQNVMLRVR